MLQIEHLNVEERIRIGNLFQDLDFDSVRCDYDDNDESFITNVWPIEVLSLDGYYPIEGYRWTKHETLFKVTCVSSEDKQIHELICADDHILLKKNDNGSQSFSVEWSKVRDLRVNDVVITKHGKFRIFSIECLNTNARLCDLQVAIAHSYYTNDILSHNSHFLTMLGCAALRQQVDVVHYTLELSESSIGIRYDSNLCDIDSNTVIDNKDSVMSKYKELKLGRLIIKEFPTSSASVFTIRSHLERLATKGFRPGMIVIDYADIMRSTRQYDSLRHELKLIYEELRALASELKVPIWTASQSNKEGSTSDIIDLANMSEAYGKGFVADVVLSISRKSHEKATGHGRLYVAKNRAGRDGLVFPVMIDTARSKFAIVGDAGSLDSAVKETDDDMKRALRAKWQELRSDPTLSRSNPTTRERSIVSDTEQ